MDKYHFDDDDTEKELAKAGVNARFRDFDCPSCNANNPADEPFGNGEQVLCNYCGTEYDVKVTDEGKLKLRET
jgi:transcription elongation factor Elf1